MDKKIDRRTFLGASALVLCLPSRLFAEEIARDVVLRFVALSDVHYDRGHKDDAPERVRFAAALKFMNEFSAKQKYDRFDALVVAGDFSNHGVPEELNPFKKTMDDNLKDSTRRVLCMGNHEYYGGNRELWEKTFETVANRRQEINGYQFITIAPEKGTCNENDYVYAREWLEQEIKDAIAADPTKPVFVVQHYHVYRTVFGSYDLPGDFHAGVKDIADILEKYPQVVHISGHSHYPSVEPRSIWQGKFTAIGTGSMSYFGLPLYETQRGFGLPENADHRQAGTCLLFEVYRDNTIRVRLYDTISSSFLDREYLIVDPLNVQKYVYTDKRYDFAKPPVWNANPKVETLDLAPNGISFRFSQANDESCLLYYRVVVESKEEGAWKEKKVAFLWSDFFMKSRQETLDYSAVGLPAGSECRLKIYGGGAFQKETEEPLVLEFATPQFTEEERNAARPQGDVLDVSFDSGKIVVVPNVLERPRFQALYKAPKVSIDPGSNRASADFNGVDESFQVPFSPLRTSIDEVSLSVTFKLDLAKKKNADPISVFGSTENGGLSFEYLAPEKKLVARIWLDSKYQTLDIPFDSEEITTACLTWNKKDFVVYLNGERVANAELNGAFRFTQNFAAQAFCLGGDVCPGFKTRWFFPGRVYDARIHSWALTPEQVRNLSQN